MMKYPIAVALPISKQEIISNELPKKIQQIANRKARFVEFRIDYEPNPLELDLRSLVGLANDNGLESIITCRIKNEGGFFSGSDAVHVEIISKMIHANPNFIDIEMATKPDVLKKIGSLLKDKKVNLIASCHDFNKTPTIKHFNEIVSKFKKKAEKLPISFDKMVILKAVFMARKPEDNLIPLEIIKEHSPNVKGVVSFCMGEVGTPSRILSVIPKTRSTREKIRGFFTFASLEEATAPGQLTLSTMCSFLKHFYQL
ncbi:MAG: type I 3-dehydroquinate dehydratase [Promethearchaeota archaeon]